MKSDDRTQSPQPTSERSKDAILSFADRLRDSRTAQPERKKTFESWVAFRVSNRDLALPVSHVREILRFEDLTGVPNAPAPVAGVMNLRGHVLPVIDTHRLLGLPKALATDRSRVLVCLIEARPIGLVADGVTGLERLETELAETVDSDEPLAEFSKGTVPRSENEPLLLLEPTRLFAGKIPELN